MINNRKTFFLGLFIFVIPFLGIPSSWRSTLIIICGLIFMAMSIKLSIPKKTTRTRTRREKITPVYVESIPLKKEEAKSVETKPVDMPSIETEDITDIK